jgi:putative transcriptional regulator
MKGDLHTLKRICEYASKVMLVGEATIVAVLAILVGLGVASFASDLAADILSKVFGLDVPDDIPSAAGLAMVAFILVLALFTVWSIYSIMISIRDEHSPFTEGNTGILIRLSKVYLVSSVVLGALSMVYVGRLGPAAFMFFGCILVCVVLYCYALTVRYGAVLQDESDHTLRGPMAIVLRLDRVMADRKMSLNELAEKVGITNVNLSNIKTGKICAIRFSTLNGICRALDCQPGDILEYVEDDDED